MQGDFLNILHRAFTVQLPSGGRSGARASNRPGYGGEFDFGSIILALLGSYSDKLTAITSELSKIKNRPEPHNIRKLIVAHAVTPLLRLN